MKTKKLKVFICFFIFFYSFNTFIYADDTIPEENYEIYDIYKTVEASASQEELPQINARHAVVLDRNSLTTIYGKKEKEQCKMASTTKIMTAILTIENCDLKQSTTVSSKSSQTGGSRLGLSKNDKITIENLLYGLMLCSGNDCAVALAEYISGSVENFAILMNKKAKELNLLNTNFVTPHGLDNDEHYTTAYDLAILADYALKNNTFSKIVRTKNYTVFINNSSKNITNTNELLGNFEGIYGVKTGFTNGANRCLITACKRENLDVICVVLGCDTKKDRTKDSINLLNYVFNNYQIVNVENIIYNNFEIWKMNHKNCFTINKGISSNLHLFLDKNHIKFSEIAINKKSINTIDTNISFESFFEAPIEKNKKIGSLSLLLDGSILYTVDILNENEINKKDITYYLFYFFKNFPCFFISK